MEKFHIRFKILTLAFRLRISVFVRVSALAMTGTMFTLSWSDLINLMSIGFNLKKSN